MQWIYFVIKFSPLRNGACDIILTGCTVLDESKIFINDDILRTRSNNTHFVYINKIRMYHILFSNIDGISFQFQWFSAARLINFNTKSTATSLRLYFLFFFYVLSMVLLGFLGGVWRSAPACYGAGKCLQWRNLAWLMRSLVHLWSSF